MTTYSNEDMGAGLSLDDIKSAIQDIRLKPIVVSFWFIDCPETYAKMKKVTIEKDGLSMTSLFQDVFNIPLVSIDSKVDKVDLPQSVLSVSGIWAQMSNGRFRYVGIFDD